MADYYPLITRAVSGLDKNTGEGRRALYDRARTALVEQLRGVTPALSESDITRERLALEEAIRRVETESIRQSRQPGAEPSERRPVAGAPPRDELPPAPELSISAPAPEVAVEGEPPAVAAAPPLSARTGEPAPAPPARRTERRWLDKKPAPPPPPAPHRAAPRQFAADGGGGPPLPSRGVSLDVQPAAHDAQAAPVLPDAEPGIVVPRPAQDPRRAIPRTRVPERRIPTPRDMELGIDALESNEPPYRPQALEPPGSPEGLRYISERARRGQELDRGGEPVARRMMNGLVAVIIAIVLVAIVGATAYWQRGNLLALVSGVSRAPVTKPVSDPSQQRAKIPDRVGQQNTAPASQQTEAPVAQRVVLYEEDPTDSAGKRFAGTALWRTEVASPGAGQPPDRAVRADITIPERGMQITWSLRRNSDKDLPASHTVSIMFTLPPDFPHGEVSEIRGVLMKQSEQTRGVSLAGLSVKVTTGFFLIGLSSADADMQRNLQMLKERSWFDIAIVYKDGRRAILAVEKGTPGERAFADGFAAWGQ